MDEIEEGVLGLIYLIQEYQQGDETIKEIIDGCGN